MEADEIIMIILCCLFAIWWFYDIIKDNNEIKRELYEDFNKNNIKYQRLNKLKKLNKLNEKIFI